MRKLEILKETIDSIVKLNALGRRKEDEAAKPFCDSLGLVNVGDLPDMKLPEDHLRVTAIIDDLSDNQKRELLALMNFGRGTSPSFDSAYRDACLYPVDRGTADYLAGKPLYRYLSEAVSELPRSGIIMA